jgi:pilus assembly protein CpaC
MHVMHRHSSFRSLTAAICALLAGVGIGSEVWGQESTERGLRTIPVLGKPVRVGEVGKPDGRPRIALRQQADNEKIEIEREPLVPLPGEIDNPPPLTPEIRRQFERFIDKTVDAEQAFDIVIGRPRLLVMKQAPTRFQIGDDAVAGVEAVSETELSISGRDIGTTVLNLWFEDPDRPASPIVLSYLIRVNPDPGSRLRLDKIYKALENEINEAFPDSVVSLSMVGNRLVVRGDAKDVQDATQILQIVAANSARRQQNNVPIERLNLQFSEPNLLSSTPGDQMELAGERVTEYLQAVGNAQQQGVINMLRVPGEQQVVLRVTVAEINRSAARNIGINFQVKNGDGTAVFSQLTGALIQSQTLGGATVIGGNLPSILDNGRIPVAINALRTLGLARSLAEPNLVTMNGQIARFHAGGSFPVPVVTGATAIGLQGVQYVPFGVQLAFTPVITDKNRIRLQMNASVSTRDPSIGANIGGGGGAGGGTNVAGLQTRNFSTIVELREGQTLAVAGLIQNNFGSNSNRVPFVGDLPLIGRFFASDGTSAQEQELMILITPELVHPMGPDACPVIPGSDAFEPDDIEFFIVGRLESRRSEDFRSSARTDLARLKKYSRCQERAIIGLSGYCNRP